MMSVGIAQATIDGLGLPVRAGGLALEDPAPSALPAVGQWLAHELHDTVVQTLTSMLVEMELVRRSGASRVALQQELERHQESTRSVLATMRGLLHELHGQVAQEARVADRCRELLTALQARTTITTAFEVSPAWPVHLPAHVAHNVCRIVEEALTNVRRHSGAGSVQLQLLSRDGHLEVRVRDDGRGCGSADGRATPGMGMRSMQERALLLGGTVSVMAASGGGTAVRLTLPMPAEVTA